MSDEREELIAEALKAFGLTRDEVMAVDVVADEVRLVTIGACKARYRRGQKITPLSDLQAGRPTMAEDDRKRYQAGVPEHLKPTEDQSRTELQGGRYLQRGAERSRRAP
jgi:methyl coenzyme M reductase subunit C-like uncharacterized protein (methanogenesis marker protein 7)